VERASISSFFEAAEISGPAARRLRMKSIGATPERHFLHGYGRQQNPSRFAEK